jgi:hypothetical protein
MDPEEQSMGSSETMSEAPEEMSHEYWNMRAFYLV